MGSVGKQYGLDPLYYPHCCTIAHTVYCPTGPLSPTALPHDTAPQHSKGTGFYKRNLTLETDVAEVDRVGRLEPLDLQVDDWDLTDI